MKLFSFVYIIFRQFPTHIITNLVLLVIMGMAGTISIFSVAPLIDYFMNPDLQNASEITRRIARMVETVGLPVNLGSLLGLFVLLHAIRSGLSALAFYALLKTKYAVMRDFMVGMYDDMFHARWFFFTSNKQGVLLNTFFREVGVVTDGFNAMMFAFAYSVQAAFYLIAPLYLSWQVTSIGLGIALVFTLPFFLLSNVSYRLGQMNTSTANDVGTVINEGFGLVKVIQGFGNQSKSIAQLGKAYDAHRQVTLKSQTLRMAIPLMFEPLGLVVIGISLVAAEWFSVPLANIGAFFLALHYTIRLVASVLAEKNTMMNFYPSYEQVRDIRAHAKQLRQWSGTRPFSGFKQEIAVDGLRFAYPDHDPVLTDIKMRIPKGKMVALVGSSGAGKSTLIDLVMGFHEPSAGHIAFDGVPLREFDVTGYRQRIGYVPQESVLFNLSIRDNLLWAKSDATDEDIETAGRPTPKNLYARSRMGTIRW